ncbi:MAG: acyltransferase family protein, partial [Oscillospiraceae bacterium]|nr:acyltransferase family protein [Oscillospiraceae bacterium]
MIWVIVVHTLYWGNFSSDSSFNLIKSFFLFEMPLFFFVTGASNSFSRSTGYYRFVFRRYKRILIPYWVFALICAGWTIGRIIRQEGGIE